MEADDDSQPEDNEEKAEDADNVMIEVTGDHSPESVQPADATGSPVASRPSTAGEQRQQETSPANQLPVPWGQSELLGIGIEEVGMLISDCRLTDKSVTSQPQREY